MGDSSSSGLEGIVSGSTNLLDFVGKDFRNVKVLWVVLLSLKVSVMRSMMEESLLGDGSLLGRSFSSGLLGNYLLSDLLWCLLDNLDWLLVNNLLREVGLLSKLLDHLLLRCGLLMGKFLGNDVLLWLSSRSGLLNNFLGSRLLLGNHFLLRSQLFLCGELMNEMLEGWVVDINEMVVGMTMNRVTETVVSIVRMGDLDGMQLMGSVMKSLRVRN